MDAKFKETRSGYQDRASVKYEILNIHVVTSSLYVIIIWTLGSDKSLGTN